MIEVTQIREVNGERKKLQVKSCMEYTNKNIKQYIIFRSTIPNTKTKGTNQ
jgi:hypothetical protein